MSSCPDSLPDDIAALKVLLLQSRSESQQLRDTVTTLEQALRGCCEITVALLRLLVVLRVLSASPRLATLISQQPLTCGMY